MGNLNDILNLSLILLAFLITWFPTLRGKFLIDDNEGIERFSDRFADGKKIDTYEHVDGDFKKTFRNTAFNRHVKMPGSIIRWLRINLGKKFTVIGKDEKGHEVLGYVQDPFRHHVMSLVIHLANVVLLYALLSQLFGPTIALYATLLFTVHPVTSQAVAWISGIGYLLSLFGALVCFNVALTLNLATALPVVLIACVISTYGLFAGAFNWVILLYLGKPWLALISLAVFIPSFLTFGRGFVTHRVKEFKKQNMGQSTILNPRKVVVMVKTLWYYICLVIYPKRLGLFHKWGYHYEERIEKIDGMFWKGLSALLICGALFILGPEPVRFGILWFFVYLALFSNFITAMQFVVDRYVFIPSIGYCVILAFISSPFPPIFFFLLGLYMMRTIMHVPAYADIISFYKSNIQNFPDSEVAFGNLGVTYMNHGKVGSAVDTWNDAIAIDPRYDVPHYNLYSIFKANGLVQKAYDHLKQCLNSKVIHFPKEWGKELTDFELSINQKPLTEQMGELNERYRAF